MLVAGLSPPRRSSRVADLHSEAPAVARGVRDSALLHLGQSGADLAARIAARTVHGGRNLQAGNISLPASASEVSCGQKVMALAPCQEEVYVVESFKSYFLGRRS